jgi:beta-lactamase superfamily II metal-dependent hydrolase
MVRVFANLKETPLRKLAKSNASVNYYALMGQYLRILEENANWYKVIPLNIGKIGWVQKSHTIDKPQLKIFVVDVGQGDGVFVESSQGLIIIDGGQYDNFYRYLRYRYRGILRTRKVQIKAMFISHPDFDHYRGLQYIIEDKNFEIGTIYHNGIVRYQSGIENSKRKMLAEGGIKSIDNAEYSYKISNLKDGLESIMDFVNNEKSAPSYRNFWRSVEVAHTSGRIGKVELLTARDKFVPGYKSAAVNKLKIEVLGPVTLKASGRREYPVFDKPPHLNEAHSDSEKQGYSHSHTRNGHSLVLKLTYGKHTFLFGGDLNIPAEKYLMRHYSTTNPFKVDVAKSCHHGSSDFSVEFIKKINAQVTVCSSGDNKTFDHPMPDSLGASAKYGRGKIPLVFSTELGRAYSIRSAKKLEDVKTHYGLINIRSNGTDMVVAQKKESSKGADKWDSFEVPFKGKYRE